MCIKKYWLFIVIILEGYVVLASELIMIRQLIPFVGNSIESIAVIIAGILIPLSLGYYVGGCFTATHQKKSSIIGNKLIKNFISASAFLVAGMSYLLLEIYFLLFYRLGVNNHILQTIIVTSIFLIYPIFLLGQTVPLISNYFGRAKISKTTGTILFFSTIGSFLGSIVTTLILMPIIGVNNTVILTVAFLSLAVLIVSNKADIFNKVLSGMILVIAVLLNSDWMMRHLNIIQMNSYSTISVFDQDHGESTVFSINHSNSAKVSSDPEQRFPYLQFIEKRFLGQSIEYPRKILVIGAGGFTVGLDDKINDYIYIDIDDSMQNVAEEYLLQEKLGPNKRFIAKPARAFLRSDSQKYDLILLDAYSNVHSIPFQLITEEFFLSAKKHLKPGGILVFNAIASPIFADKFSLKLDNTFRKSFGNFNREVIENSISGDYANIIYSYFHNIGSSTDTYNDNKNCYFFDYSKKSYETKFAKNEG